MKPQSPWYQTRKRHYWNRKLQVNIFDEYKWKNSQQNISKLNPTIHKKDQSIWWSWIHSRVTRMVQQMQINQCDTPHQQRKRWKHMLITIGTEKSFHKIQNSFLIKSHKSGYRRNISQHNQSHLWQTHSQYNSWWWKAESLLA